MPLTYNFGKEAIPNVLSQIYKYTHLERTYTVRVDGQMRTLNPEQLIGAAWQYIEKNCAKSKDCNTYFANLPKKMTLADILSKVNFVVHLLTPKAGHTEMDLPEANSAGSDFALSTYTFLEKTSPDALAATILHEIAHYAGATTDQRAANALDAENALIHCGLRQYFNRNATG